MNRFDVDNTLQLNSAFVIINQYVFMNKHNYLAEQQN